MKAILVIALLLFLIAIGPLCTIWALNTLFPVLNIAYTFETWCAVVVLWGLGFGIRKQSS
jgi:cadmium resistance protein CadD (predicted permease)